ncbi:hypothetical protein A4X06_0g5833 [Tilletia controversa]|uniref:Rhamnogalacturonase A/B/Epimerase-like pectate lyase domain-containing protein n=3 Tax=Tilletia TaxID=13289 RepID=A0A8X7SVW5_9BASI|nr:hypothetical protein CF336_g5355 [Tilletia laevis]KAE8245082.1 hypothetical protein A4X06_0g5833 [Tilletia controversa]
MVCLFPPGSHAHRLQQRLISSFFCLLPFSPLLLLLLLANNSVLALGSDESQDPDTQATRTMTAQRPIQTPAPGNDDSDDEEDYIPPMFIKEIDDPDGWKRPDSNYSYVPFWYERIAHHGASPYHPNASTYKIYRNVRDYGATGDGVTLDDDAIEKAMTDGGRCGQGCGSSTIQQAVVYFPPGTYLLSKPIQSYYGTSLVGDPNWRPVIKAAQNFTGIALVDENPYGDDGKSWFINQVNFFRQTRNVVFDVRDQKDGLEGTGIHRPTSQATALSNCHFEGNRTNPNTTQQGVLMEAGSGGNMGNLTFRGGQYGISIGNQQFTLTDLRFESHRKAAVNVYWSWAMNFQNVEVRDTPIGLLAPTNVNSTVDQLGSGQQVSSLTMIDWRMQDVERGLVISSPNSGVFTVENIRALRSTDIVATSTQYANTTVVAGEPDGQTHLPAWIQGGAHEGDRAGRWVQKELEPARRPKVMRDLQHSDGRWFTRPRPEYGDARLEDIIDVKCHGAKGDGVTDDTEALQKSLDRAKIRKNHLIFIPHGTYIVTSTLHIHPGIRIVGEAFSVLMGAGEAFNDIDNPQVVFRFGRRCKTPKNRKVNEDRREADDFDDEDSDDEDSYDEDSGDEDPDDEDESLDDPEGNDDSGTNSTISKRRTRAYSDQYGRVEVSDIVFSTRGPAAGAIVIEWNLRGAKDPMDPEKQGIVGMWDSHVRLAGFRGSELEGDVCPVEGNGTKIGTDMDRCRAAFLGMHITRHATAYLYGTWVWLADHDLDLKQTNKTSQITAYSGRGMLVENTKGGPVWMYGVGSEHHILVQFNLYRARKTLISVPQTETAYHQGSKWPSATETQPISHTYHDPLFDKPDAPTLNNSLHDPAYNRGLGLRVRQSRDVIIYGAALWSFFNSYSTACSQKNGPCQRSMVSMERIRPDANVVLYNLNTIGTDSMLDLDHLRVVPTSFWRNGFVTSIARWTAGRD